MTTRVKSCTCGFDLCPECGQCHSLHCEQGKLPGIDCMEAMQEQSTRQREQGEAQFLIDSMRTVVQDVPSYTSQYATLREQVQQGLLTEREYSLIEEGRNI